MKLYDFSQLDILIGIYLWRLDTVANNPKGEYIYSNSDFPKYFDLLPSDEFQLESFSSGISYPIGRCSFYADTFHASFSFVLKKAGLFLLDTDTHFRSRFDPDFPGRCSSIAGGDTYYVYFDINEDHDDNFHLLSEAYDSTLTKKRIEMPQEYYYDRGAYCFRVEE